MPKVCTDENMHQLDEIYKAMARISGAVLDPRLPTYTFPQKDEEKLTADKGFFFYLTIIVLIGLLVLSIVGYLI